MPDLAEPSIIHLIRAMRQVFNPTAPTPPVGGGTEHVRFFAGDQMPTAAVDMHREGCGCGEPLLWVRLVQRYRTTPPQFPNPVVLADSCITDLVPAIELEVGVMRCAVVKEEPEWCDYEKEASVSLDDSWRVEAAMCRAMDCAVNEQDAKKTAVGNVVPWGPQGGVIAVYGTVWVQLK